MDRPLFPGFSLSEAGQLYARRFEERSRNLALDFAQSRALLVLAENEGVTQQRLSELTAIASPWLVRILDRGPAVTLAHCRRIGLREALRGLSTKETAILAKTLHRVIANLSGLDRLVTSPLVTFQS